MECKKTAEVSKNLQQKNSETVTNENDEEIPIVIPKERHVHKKDKMTKYW